MTAHHPDPLDRRAQQERAEELGERYTPLALHARVVVNTTQPLHGLLPAERAALWRAGNVGTVTDIHPAEPMAYGVDFGGVKVYFAADELIAEDA